MAWLGWFARAKHGGNEVLAKWHREWTAAARAPSAAELDRLRIAFATLPGDADDREVEQEMLAGLEELLDLVNTVAASGPPALVTGHRVIGREACHFSAPATLQDDDGGPSGTLLLTPARAIFVGGARTLTLPWHAVGACVRQDRDLLLSRKAGGAVHRVRCNTYGDALRAAFLARYLGVRTRV